MDGSPAKLNIGSGGKPLEGFADWDLRDGHQAYPLAVPDASVPEIYASHVLEHLPHHQTLAVLRDWYRALVPGGRLRVAVPDFDKILAAWITGERREMVEPWLMGGQTDANDQHRAMFTEAKLRGLFAAAGFERIEPWTAEVQDCASLPVSLNLCGYRPLVDAPPKPTYRTAAVWTVPRLGFQATFGCIYEALPPHGIPIVRTMGAFWGQGMELGMGNAIAEYAPEYILSLDYDSLFSPADLTALLALMDAHPEVDALCPNQWHRTELQPLWTPADGRPWQSADLSGDLCELATAHFGLTLIRTAALRELPHPWFLPVPAPDGTWGPGKLDDDIYFWRHFRAAGHRVFLAPKVAIGHAELDIVWPGADLQTRTQGMFDYFHRGKPEGVFGGH